jgi:hypothetical protein
MARLTLALPEGVVRHPALLDQVQDELGRPSVVDVAHAGIAVSYTAEGGTFEEACEDSRGVCEAMLGRLSLGHEAIEEHVLVAADELPIWPILHPPTLRGLPDA